jgi:hypothetical protein
MLTDDQQHQLLVSWIPKYEKALKAKSDAAAAFLDVIRKIKADKVSIHDIKTAIKLRSPEGEAEVKERLEADLRVARWMNSPIGSQFSLFRDDGVGEESAAFLAGREAGLAGEAAKAPRKFDANEWLKGWQSGQAVHLSNIRQQHATNEAVATEAGSADDASGADEIADEFSE